MGKETCSGRRRRREQEEQEQEQEEEQDIKPLMPPPPPRRGRSTRAAASASARQDDDDEEEQDVLNGGGGGSDDEEEEDAGSKASKGKGKRRASSSGKKPAAKKRASSAADKAEHATQSGYFCGEEVEVGFTFTQVPFAAAAEASGRGGGGRRNRQAAEEAGGDQDVKYPGTQQVSQDVLKDHEQNKFVQLPQAQQDQAVGAAVRFILFKGCRREPVLKKAVNDEIAKHYGRSLVKPILKEAAAKLEKTFGYMLIAPPALNFPKEKDTYYLVNKVKNPALQRQLNAYGRDVGYRGFVMVVLGLLFCSASSKIKEKELLEQIASLDDELRFSKGDDDGEASIAGTLEGVGDVALALERMRKEHYVVREKEQGLKKPGQDGQPVAEFWYKLGPRAYVEVGPRQLLSFLSESQGQETDATLLREIEQEEARNAEELAELTQQG